MSALTRHRKYEGYGWWKMMEVAFNHNLNKENSDLIVDDPLNPESHWMIKVKRGFLMTTYP